MVNFLFLSLMRFPCLHIILYSRSPCSEIITQVSCSIPNFKPAKNAFKFYEVILPLYFSTFPKMEKQYQYFTYKKKVKELLSTIFLTIKFNHEHLIFIKQNHLISYFLIAKLKCYYIDITIDFVVINTNAAIFRLQYMNICKE